MACRVAAAALALAAALAALGCSPGSGPDANGIGADAGAAADGSADRGGQRPVVQVPSGDGPRGYLDPAAAPTSDLGRLRARYLPVWTPEFDWAFPPEACGTAWELDGIAEPDSGSLAVLGDPVSAVALAVMRYEHQFTAALAEPDALDQLCVATASVDPARRDALDVLASYLDSGVRRRDAAAFPEAVRVLGASPTGALAVACLRPGYSEAVPADGGAEAEEDEAEEDEAVPDDVALVETPQAQARLQAYSLTLTRGLEDRVADLSYRVSEASHRPADDCSALEGWTAEWQAHMQAWIDEGRLWTPLAAEVTVAALCDSPPPDGPDECPRDWQP